MKIYYAISPIAPTDENHFIAADLTPDMITPLYKQYQVLSENDSKYYRKYRKDIVLGVFEFTSVFTDDYRQHIYYVSNNNGSMSKYYLPTRTDDATVILSQPNASEY